VLGDGGEVEQVARGRRVASVPELLGDDLCGSLQEDLAAEDCCLFERI